MRTPGAQEAAARSGTILLFPLFLLLAGAALAAPFDSASSPSFPSSPNPSASPSLRAYFDPVGVVPGAAVPVVIASAGGPLPTVARAGGEEFPLLPLPDGRALALVGVELGFSGKVYPVEFPGAAGPGGAPPLPFTVELPLSPVEYGVQEITLPKNMVVYPPEAVPRIERESRSLRDALSGRARDLSIHRPFERPVTGRISAGFGGARILNGMERSPHGGEDIASPLGTRVAAANDGRVALVGDFYLTGKTVVIDHGQGIFTLYAHLGKIRHGHGTLLNRGDTVGTVGATGRATGPHLHFGVVIRGVKVDPSSLKALDLLFG